MGPRAAPSQQMKWIHRLWAYPSPASPLCVMPPGSTEHLLSFTPLYLHPVFPFTWFQPCLQILRIEQPVYGSVCPSGFAGQPGFVEGLSDEAWRKGGSGSSLFLPSMVPNELTEGRPRGKSHFVCNNFVFFRIQVQLWMKWVKKENARPLGDLNGVLDGPPAEAL